MMPQLSLTYRPSTAGRDDWERELAILRAIVEHLGRKEVSFEIDASGSYLSDALSERDRKRWAAEWTRVVKHMLMQRHDDVSRSLLRQLADQQQEGSPFVIDESSHLTPEQERDEAMTALKRSDPAAYERLRKRGFGRR